MSRAHLYLLVSAVLLSSTLADPLPGREEYAALQCMDLFPTCPQLKIDFGCNADMIKNCPHSCDSKCSATTTTTTTTATSTTAMPVTTTTAAPTTTTTTTTVVPVTTTTPMPPVKDCYDVLQRGNTSEGYYQVQRPGSTGLTSLYCVSGWEVVQRRTSGQLSFDRVYAEYQKGFGKPESEYWMGLDAMHQLTSSHKYMARVEVDVQNGDSATAGWKKVWDEFESFSVGAPSSGYVLSVGARVDNSSTGGDDLQIGSGQPFEAKDKAHTSSMCADLFGGGFWFDESCGPNPNANACITSTEAWCGVYGGDIRSSIILIRLAP